MTEPSSPPAAPAEIHFAISQKAAATLGSRLDGNGLKAQQVLLARHETLVHQIPGALTVRLKPEIAKSQLKGRHPQGQVLDSHAAVLARSAGEIAALLGGRDVQQEILQATGKMPGQGFGMEPLTLSLHAAKKEFSSIDKCLKCNGDAFLPCSQCNAAGKIPCKACNGQGFMPCQTCFGDGQVHQHDGSTAPCPQCQGTGKIQCLSCQGYKTMVCTACQGQCKISCTECGQSGFLTHLYQVTYKASLLFEADLRQIPPDVREIIGKLGVKQLATEGHAEIFRQPPEIREDHIYIPFTALLPVAQAEFSIEGKSCPATVAGLRGRILKIDPVLDALVKPGIKALQSLSRGPMASQNLIDTACKYRLIREALSGLTLRSKKNVYQKLVKDYPLILSAKYANATIHYANMAMQSIGAGPRNKGLLAGTVLATLPAAGYYLTPVRSRILDAMLQNNIGRHIVLLDIAVGLLGWAVAVVTIKFIAAQAFRKLLPDNIQTGKNNLATAGPQGLWALPASLAAGLLIAAFSAAKPEWMLLLLKTLGVQP
ncbi:MAG: hypothetical protein K8R48_08495 [Alphaproteobacteria bacterium]|nr:hypothetical protein [Alphaproteobacteria bacterium]